MRITQMWKKSALFLLAGSLLVLATGCGSSGDSSPEAGSTEEVVEKEVKNANYVADGIVLPEHFDNMIYPMEAITVEQYSQGLTYYQNGETPDSFWFPMAVLSSLMAEEDKVDREYDSEFYYYPKEQIDQFADALFYDYSKKKMPLADLDESCLYACYDEEKQKYGLLCGNIGDLGIQIVNCSKINDHYELEVELINTERKDIVSEYLISMYPQMADKVSNGLFAYSIGSCDLIESSEIDELGTDLEYGDGPSIDEDYDIVDGDEITDNSQVDDSEILNQITIDKEEALALAKAYMGEDYTFTFRGKVTIGEYDYYDFAIKEKSTKDVLVCINGLDVVSGRHNKDGSWSFDQ
ncbi:MAG: hypothetical protein Q4E53_01475 [Eubacteriales bacterium]|nr:hypothetical protein [Eubacteriales bacterium]